jgi:hypothetical protein
LVSADWFVCICVIVREALIASAASKPTNRHAAIV